MTGSLQGNMQKQRLLTKTSILLEQASVLSTGTGRMKWPITALKRWLLRRRRSRECGCLDVPVTGNGCVCPLAMLNWFSCIQAEQCKRRRLVFVHVTNLLVSPFLECCLQSVLPNGFLSATCGVFRCKQNNPLQVASPCSRLRSRM